MSTTELTRAMSAVPNILEALGIAKDIAAPICEALAKYGCRNQEAITKFAIAAFPEFVKVSDRFFTLLNATINNPEQLPPEEYDIILHLVYNDESSNLQEKTNAVTESINSLKDNQFSHKKGILKIIGVVVLSISSITGATLIAVRAIAAYKQIKKEKAITERTNIRFNVFSQFFQTVQVIFQATLRAISPFSLIGDILLHKLNE